MYTLGKYGLIFSVFFIFSACSDLSRRAPVEEGSISSGGAGNSYRVNKGDTLFSIAWRYGMDYRKLASNNNIDVPYVIYPGQKILLIEQVGARSTNTAWVKPAKLNVSRINLKKIEKPKTQSVVNTKAVKGSNPDVWYWPTEGDVIKVFGSGGSVHKGIDISGKLGEPVYATVAGKVVYAGSGILGYGNLLILKHSEQYLSAYGHNSRLLVREGTEVKAREKIAEKGSSGTNKVKLHFEIRREGKPVDPIRLLPSR